MRTQMKRALVFRVLVFRVLGLKPGFHIVISVVSVVSAVPKKFIGQIEFILSRTTSCICRFFLYWAFVREVSIKLYLSYEFFSYDRYNRYNDMETMPGFSLRTSQKQPFFFRVTSIRLSTGRQDSRNYWIQMRIIEFKYILTEYKCELLNTNIFLLNTNGNYWIQMYFYWIQMWIIEYKYKLLNVKWCYWILQQFGNHSVDVLQNKTIHCWRFRNKVIGGSWVELWVKLCVLMST